MATIWRLKSGEERRFKTGHPWVYSNELQESPKGIEPGAPIELRDAGGKFLARGYGNPSSLIAFRVLSRDPDITEPDSNKALLEALKKAGKFRKRIGWAENSYRLCFGEADFLPGLVIDRYRLKEGQVFVVQAHTAGANRWLARMPEILESFSKEVGGVGWDKTAIVYRNDLGIRKLEGLTEEDPQVIREVAGVVLTESKILIDAANGAGSIGFVTDLVGGQKTGFFLDQAANVQMAVRRLSVMRPAKILDLCSYVGQWSVQFAHALKGQGVQAEFTAVDASAKALESVRQNMEAQSVKCQTIKADVLKDLGQLKDKSYDLVIADPPALIKGRKDIPVGTHAYLQLNTEVFRLVRRGGAVITCSCSALLEEESFLKTISKASHRNQTRVRWVGRGMQGPDHPVLTEFPEGRYLKAWMGVTEES